MIIVVLLVSTVGCSKGQVGTKLTQGLESIEQIKPIELEYRLTDAEAGEAVAEKIAAQLKTAGIMAQVRPGEENQILVSLPGNKEHEIGQLREVIEATGSLRFLRIDEEKAGNFFEEMAEQLPDGFQVRALGHNSPSVTHGDLEALREFFADRVPENRLMGYEFHPVYTPVKASSAGGLPVMGGPSHYLDKDASSWSSYLLIPDQRLTGAHIERVAREVDASLNRPYVALDFSEEGAAILEQVTSEAIGDRMAVVIGDEVVIAPRISEPVRGGHIRISLGAQRTYDELMIEAAELEDKVKSQMGVSIEFVSSR